MIKNTISFKNVGEFKTDKKFQTKKNEIPIGIKTPLSFGDRELFAMNLNLVDQIKDNFKNLILTNYGERLGRYDFGTSLREMTLELSRDDFDIEVARRIKSAVSKYMPFLELENLTTSINHKENRNGTANLRLLVSYDISALNVRNQQLEIDMVLG